MDDWFKKRPIFMHKNLLNEAEVTAPLNYIFFFNGPSDFHRTAGNGYSFYEEERHSDVKCSFVNSKTVHNSIQFISSTAVENHNWTCQIIIFSQHYKIYAIT
jgi:hypothetical protein